MHTTINSGDLRDMRRFDLSALNGLMNICTDMTVTRNGVHLWIGQRHVFICCDVIDFMFLNRAFEFDEVIIKDNNHNGIQIIDFIIQSGESEVYMSLVSDVVNKGA